jgi:hypothetical protein
MSDGNNGAGGELLGRDDILNADDIVYEEVPVPEWTKNGKAGVVRVKALAAIERDDFEKSLVLGTIGNKNTKIDTSNIRAKLCARAIVGRDNQRLFTDNDVMRLGAKSAAALNRVYEVAARLAKITEEDIEELKGNSDSDPSGVSLSV